MYTLRNHWDLKYLNLNLRASFYCLTEHKAVNMYGSGDIAPRVLRHCSASHQVYFTPLSRVVGGSVIPTEHWEGTDSLC